eukprot:CAMPEP_0185572470 /NCGR_PEP_ID=MMETSP0434-20130131/4394_1 /TAXON_ID=626734 ORGANISM="Favella taraikaensis, Strain Fe Narragansett Bay" /NCGR_SAMPLE_ID=MMETSP0434 /ASSEMBLY_ACC=CAM_ASM_000379 /LENGTH=51 /DNA_ID=CAMNT_0028188349 /DNA_START=849 /DNA_END=1004 /DNA_ORIENTATION=+
MAQKLKAIAETRNEQTYAQLKDDFDFKMRQLGARSHLADASRFVGTQTTTA